MDRVTQNVDFYLGLHYGPWQKNVDFVRNLKN